MKFVRFTTGTDENVYVGVMSGEGIEEIRGNIYGEWQYTERTYELDTVRLQAPLVPNEIIGIGKNYVGTKEELTTPPEMPILFFKPKTTVVGPADDIILPTGVEEIKFESELAVVIGKTANNIDEKEALDYVLGYTVANDIAALDYFHPGGHWTIGKSFDTFCPLGPVIETDLDIHSLTVEAYLNGECKQSSPTNLMITSIEQQIAYISSFMTLKPGDVILSGTPVGAEMMRASDAIECSIDGIGKIINKVVNK